jgi:RNA-binding protein
MLTSKQRAYLRGIASTYETIFQIGKGGVTEAMCKDIGEALRKRELIKLRVLENSGWTAREAADAIAEQTGSDVVQVIGSRFVLYRHSQKLGEKCIQLVQPKQRKTAGKKYDKG